MGNSTSRFPRGKKVEGTVKKITEYGVFVEIEAGIDGLCHISEISEDRGKKADDVVNESDKIEVMVLDVDPAERRISLSIKAAQEGTGDYRAYMHDNSGETALGTALGAALMEKFKPEDEQEG